MEWFREAPQIIHSEPCPGCCSQMIRDAAKNIHIRNQATALLECYASHATGFRPAAELITQQTGIAANKISEVRKKLVDYGLIAYKNDPGFIFINWQRISTYALLPEPLKLHQYKNYFFAPVKNNSGKWAFLFRRTIGMLGKRYRIRNPRKLSRKETRFFSLLEKMTEEEYFQIVAAIGKDRLPSMPEQKTGVYNILDERYCFLPEEETAFQYNYDSDSTSLPRVVTTQLPF